MAMLLRFNKIIFMVLFFLSSVCISSHAQNALTPDIVEPFKINMTLGKSIVMKSDVNIKRISIGSPETVDFILLSPKEIYLNPKAAGLTNMILWQKDNVTAIYDIEVKYDLSRLKEKLYQILPDEKDIHIMSTNNSITLTGRVSSASNLSQAMVIAQSYAPKKGKVNNLLSVGGTHQVMLEVKIAEISRSLGRDMGISQGIDSLYVYGETETESNTMTVATTETFVSMLPGFVSTLAPAFDGAIQHFSGGYATWTMALNALKSKGLVKILAEPNLVTLSGKTAEFRAGGEFPIPVSDEDGVVVSFKPFGVGVSFTPNVLSKDKINIQVKSGFSELDFSTAVQYGGYVVPGLSTRNAETNIELADGQSFVIAGLLSDNIRENVQKFPFLGDIPILGALFKSKSFIKNETELVMIVTPHLVKPINKDVLPVPTDTYTEADDLEFYFDIEKPAKKPIKNSSADGNMDGQFGHSFE